MRSLIVLTLVVLCALAVESNNRSRESGEYSGPPPPPGLTPRICRLPPKKGKCYGVCPRYYYDVKRRTCRKFLFGCCGGNANNFRTKALCQRVCMRRTCPKMACYVKACSVKKCRKYPKARCVAVCPCQAVWLYKGRDVTKRC